MVRITSKKNSKKFPKKIQKNFKKNILVRNFGKTKNDKKL